MPSLALAGASGGSFATPLEWRWMTIPCSRDRLQPSDDFVGGRRLAAFQGSPLQDALDRQGHVQPRTAQWRVHQHNPVREAPAHEEIVLMPDQIIQHQQQAQRRWLGWECDPDL